MSPILKNFNLIFRQLFDKNSSTYTYLIGDRDHGVAALIDSVKECTQRDFNLLSELSFQKVYLINTHAHADHITGNAILKEKCKGLCSSVLSKYYPNARADHFVGDGDELDVGRVRLRFLHTPGHTSGCLSIVDHDNKRVFTGDTLLIRGCGRTDFQNGSSDQLYDSVHEKLFSLPRDFLVYPAHDYNGITSSTIGEEIDFNPRLSKSKSEFVQIMASLNLTYPKLLDIAVPANLNCGYEELSRKSMEVDINSNM